MNAQDVVKKNEIPPDQPVFCNKCGREYAPIKLLKFHMRIHTKAYMEAKYICDICGNDYRSNVSLQNHINTIQLLVSTYLNLSLSFFSAMYTNLQVLTLYL